MHIHFFLLVGGYQMNSVLLFQMLTETIPECISNNVSWKTFLTNYQLHHKLAIPKSINL